MKGKCMIVFSIITAFYRGNQYLINLFEVAKRNAETLRAKNINAKVELVIINDSPDYKILLPEKIEQFELKIINHNVNSGIHQARVTGLLNCSGDYITFLDQDDLLEDDSLYCEYEVMGDKDAVIANAYIEQKNGTKKILYKSKGQFNNALFLDPYIKAHNQIISPGHCLIRRTSIPKEWCKYIMQTNGSDDLFLWILMLSIGKKFCICEKVLYTHKYTGTNLSAEEFQMASSSLELADYLKRINYVSKKTINNFVRSREQKIIFSKCKILRKIIIMMKNFDLYLPRLYWKLRGMIK